MSILPLSSPISLFGLGSISPLAATLAQTSTSALTSFASSSTIVEISGLGHLLSSIVNFQNRLSLLEPGSTSSALGSNFGTDFGSLAAEAQSFVDAFNALQEDLSPLGSFSTGGGLFGLLPGSALTTQLTDSLNERLGSTFDNGESGLTQLADLGIELQPSPFSGLGQRASIDLAQLRSAFEDDPAGSFSLLSRAVESFSTLASELTSEPDSGSLAGSLLQFGAAQQSLALFNSFAGSQTALRGTTDLLALAALNSGSTSSQGQLLAAMNQFSLVSSLLG